MAASQSSKVASRLAELKLPATIGPLPPMEECERKQPEKSEDGGSCGGECRTPTSRESKIPASTSCPPAPKKPRRMLLEPRKRRPSDLTLLRVSPEVLYRLFRPLEASSFVCLPTAPTTKKRKLHCLDNE